MKENLIIMHGGGPTAVLNCSLYGAVREAQKSGVVEHVYGAVGGTGGLLREQLLDFNAVPEEQLELLPTTPATAIGTSRDALEAEDYARMTEILEAHNIRYVLMNGGNGTMDACGKLAAACKDKGIKVMGIPKTMDNDIAVTDHCPGFGSVARYMAGTVRELGVDVRSLPIHVVVLESLGRNAGWTTAASALAREQGGDAPHLAQMIVRRLGIKARSEKPGILARASIAWQSPVDAAEAELAGREACRAALAGETGKMVGFRRLSTEPYRCETFLIPIEEVMLGERVLTPEYLTADGTDVTEAFRRWCAPLIGPELPSMARL